MKTINKIEILTKELEEAKRKLYNIEYTLNSALRAYKDMERLYKNSDNEFRKGIASGAIAELTHTLEIHFKKETEYKIQSTNLK